MEGYCWESQDCTGVLVQKKKKYAISSHHFNPSMTLGLNLSLAYRINPLTPNDL
jgi:hypothetical protein